MWNNKEVKYMTWAYVFVFAVVLWFSKSLLTALLSCGLCYGVSLFFFSRIFKKLNKVNKAANQVITHRNDPSFEMSFSSYEEGDIGILMDNFSEMVRILKESIETQQKEKIFLKDLINDIFHQLKTPLSSLVVFNDILMKEEMDRETSLKMLTESEKQLTRIQWLIISMLKLARIEAGAVQFQKEEQPLYPTIAEAVASLNDKIEQKGHMVLIECEENLLLLHDKEWLQEALINIIKNAIEYTKEQGKIKIQAEQNPLATVIRVTDNGPGIPESEMGKIFTRFYRVQNEINPNSVGLGLAITKSIVEGQGGRIRVESDTKEGSSFTRFILTFFR
ncbi:MAG: HAMP domain-containing histidine kinase [Lachnospiraceae bacterium]|nr:HAMP domain-containing histidine kinase [Lachnospiraceae bacterium]